jgi:hypothetical protein
MPKNADNAKEEDVGSGFSSNSENGMDKILHDSIEAQERLHERDQELKWGTKRWKELQELVHTLTIGFTAKDLIEEDEVSRAVLKRTVNRLTAGLEEKVHQLRANDWDITTISEEKVLLETALKKHNQDVERPVGILSEKPGTMKQLHHAGKVTTADADREVEGLVSQGHGK